MASPLAYWRYVRWRSRKAWRTRLDPTKRWRLELRREVGFWGNVIDGGGEFPDAWARQSEPNAEIGDRLIVDRIELVEADPITILDVGAGPVSTVGTVLPGRTVDLTATDPLADDYATMLAEAGLDPPVKTLFCRGEDLLEHFGGDRFDMVYSRNAVDHSVDPLTILRNMIGLAKPGGFVLLRHYRNEGVAQDYEGLHQWNFDLRDGELILWNRRETHNLHDVLGDEVEIEVEIQPWTPRDRPPWLACAMRKRTPAD